MRRLASRNARFARGRLSRSIVASEQLESRRLLSSVVVNTIVDQTDPAGSKTISLRDAIAMANKSTTATTITFDSKVFATHQTIKLNGTELQAGLGSQVETITGPAVGVTINGNAKSRVLFVAHGRKVAISKVGIFNGNSGTASGGVGGGIYNQGTLSLTGVTISGNTASGDGGGIESSLILTESSVLTLTNVTITGNKSGRTTGNGGGGLRCTGHATLRNVTIANNSTADKGGGISVGSASVSIGNTIVAGNTASGGAPDVSGAFASAGHNLIGKTDGSSGWVSSDLKGTIAKPLSAKLGALSNNGGATNTLLPQSGSPVIDHGANSLVPSGITSDQRGSTRIVNGTVDIGAVEVQAPVAVIKITAPANQTAINGASTPVKLGSFTQSNATGPFKLDVNWGDGSTDTIVTMSAAGTIPATAHTFAKAGSLTVSETITDAKSHKSNKATFTDAVSASSNVITVTSLTDTLTLSGQTTLRGALQTSNAASVTDTIQFAAGLFSAGAATLKMAGTEFPITHSVNIVGPGQSKLTIDGQSLSRIFNITSSSAVVLISGMTLTRGQANGPNNGPGGSGGAIYNTGKLTLQSVVVSSSFSNTNFIETDTITYGGGGVYNFHGSLTLQSCTIQNNSTSNEIDGGGLLSSGGIVNIQASTFSGNKTGGGLGEAIATANGASMMIDTTKVDKSIYSDANLTMTNSTVGPVYIFATSIITNCTTGHLEAATGTASVSKCTLGSVASVNYGTLKIDTSTLAQVDQQYGTVIVTNSAFKPSGTGTFALSVGQGTTLLENDTITGFSSTGEGTLYFPVGANATIRNCTIAGNKADRGGGIFIASGNLNMDSTIVANNTAITVANDISGYVSGQNNLVGDPTGAFLLSANNLTGVNPKLGALANNGGPTLTMALLSGSPAINAGSNIDNLLDDQRGLPRVSGKAADIGAFELQS